MTNEEITKLTAVLMQEWPNMSSQAFIKRVIEKMSPPKERKYRVTFDFYSRKTFGELLTHRSVDFTPDLKKFLAFHCAADVENRITRRITDITED